MSCSQGSLPDRRYGQQVVRTIELYRDHTPQLERHQHHYGHRMVGIIGVAEVTLETNGVVIVQRLQSGDSLWVAAEAWHSAVVCDGDYFRGECVFALRDPVTGALVEDDPTFAERPHASLEPAYT